MTTRDLVAWIVLIVVLAIATLASKLIDSSAIDKLEDRLTAQTANAAAKDVLIGQVRQQAATDSIRADSLAEVVGTIQRDLTRARARSVRTVVVVDSIAATIEEDTLTPALQALLAAQRDVCAACAVERDLERRRADVAVAELTLIGPRLDSARVLLFAVQAQRDSALALAGDAVDRLNPSWFRLLLQDLPQKAACAGGGAAVAAMNDGDVWIGAGIGLAACLVVMAVF